MAGPVHARRPQLEVELQAIEDYRRFAAVTIQRYYRGWIVRLHRARKDAARREQEQSAAARQAEAARLYTAARTIQDGWRSYRNKRVYRFFRDLIKFREAAEPRQLLRSINAPEAALVEPAAGLHIRFRLGGSSFPPILLYKVFTHRPVTDICAFGPRDYAAEAAAAKATQVAPATVAGAQQQPQQHNGSPTLGSSSGSRGRAAGHSGWYCRDDRNGWRPVVELQQQLQYQQGTHTGSSGGYSSSSSGSRRGRHRSAVQVRQKRSRLQLRHSRGSGGPGTAAAAADSGWGAEPGVQQEPGSDSEVDPWQDRSSSADACCMHRSKQPQQFHHSPLVRRAERAQKLKQRRRQWLLKMYRTGMQAAGAATGMMPGSSMPDPGQPDLSGGAAAGGGCGYQLGAQQDRHQHQQQQQQQQQQQCPPGALQAAAPGSCRRCSSEERILCQLEQQLRAQSWSAADNAAASGACSSSSSSAASQQPAAWGTAGADGDGCWEDPDDLLLLGLDAGILAWAQRLDFSSYQQQWSSTAVTLGSEAAVPQSERLLLQQLG